MDVPPPPRSRSVEGLLRALSDDGVDAPIRDLVKRPTPAIYARVRAESPEERLRHAFALTAFAVNLRSRAHAARS